MAWIVPTIILPYMILEEQKRRERQREEDERLERKRKEDFKEEMKKRERLAP